MNIIYAIQPACPQNLGYFYCDDCYNKALEEASWTDYPYDIKQHFGLGCGKNVNGKYCGYTHLGYRWCDECLKLGRKECMHGNFVAVGRIQEEPEMEIVN